MFVRLWNGRTNKCEQINVQFNIYLLKNWMPLATLIFFLFFVEMESWNKQRTWIPKQFDFNGEKNLSDLFLFFFFSFYFHVKRNLFSTSRKSPLSTIPEKKKKKRLQKIHSHLIIVERSFSVSLTSRRFWWYRFCCCCRFILLVIVGSILQQRKLEKWVFFSSIFTIIYVLCVFCICFYNVFGHGRTKLHICYVCCVYCYVLKTIFVMNIEDWTILICIAIRYAPYIVNNSVCYAYIYVQCSCIMYIEKQSFFFFFFSFFWDEKFVSCKNSNSIMLFLSLFKDCHLPQRRTHKHI